MNVILFGYRGSGKTTVGRGFAERLGHNFVDTDEEACRRFEIDSIAEIWEKFGEPAWRAMEVRVTRELVVRPAQVIALGGGTLMQPEARQAVEQARDTCRVYLRCEPAELLRRIDADAASVTARPSLTAHGGGLREIEAVLAEREPTYREVADEVLDVTELGPDAVVGRLIEKLL